MSITRASRLAITAYFTMSVFVQGCDTGGLLIAEPIPPCVDGCGEKQNCVDHDLTCTDYCDRNFEPCYVNADCDTGECSYAECVEGVCFAVPGKREGSPCNTNGGHQGRCNDCGCLPLAYFGQEGV